MTLIETSRIRRYHVWGDEARHRAVYVEWRGQYHNEGPILWAVSAGGDLVLNNAGGWEIEPQPSSRTPTLISRCRWESFDAAYAAAVAALASMPDPGSDRAQ